MRGEVYQMPDEKARREKAQAAVRDGNGSEVPVVNDTLSFVVSTADLDFALDILAELLPNLLYPVALAAFTAERERRTLMAPAMPITMTRRVYEALPSAIKPLLGAPVA